MEINEKLRVGKERKDGMAQLVSNAHSKERERERVVPFIHP